MNKILLALALVSLQGIALAQETQSYICLNLGPSIPMGDYASKDYNNPQASFAKIGPEFSLEGVYFFMDYLGVGGKTGLNIQAFDKSAYRDGVINSSPFIVDADIYASPYMNIHSVAGLYINLPVTEKFHITPKVLAGLLITLQADVTTDVYYQNGNYDYYYSDAAAGSTFTPLLAVDFRYVVTDHFMLKVNVEHISATQNIEYDIYGSFIGVEQKVSMLSISASAGLAF